MLGLPDEAAACLFDLDGVLTRTASVHAAAWKEMFDGFLRERAGRTGEPFTEFDPVHDYGRYVDGKKREDGTRSFLESRGITLPEGDPDDPPEAETVRGLGNRKNALVLKLIEEKGVETFDGSIDYVRAARKAGLKTAVVSSSANTVQVLRTVGITDLFDARVDGVVAAERHLPGKPAPDMFLEGAGTRRPGGAGGGVRGRARRGPGGTRRRVRAGGRRQPGGRGACRGARRARRRRGGQRSI